MVTPASQRHTEADLNYDAIVAALISDATAAIEQSVSEKAAMGYFQTILEWSNIRSDTYPNNPPQEAIDEAQASVVSTFTTAGYTISWPSCQPVKIAW